MRKKAFLLFLLIWFCVTGAGLSSLAQSRTVTDSMTALLDRLPGDTTKVNTLLALGQQYQESGKVKEAIATYQAAGELAHRLAFKRGVAISYFRIGVVLGRRQRNYTASLNNLLEALKTWEEIGDCREIADTYHNIGLAYHAMSNFAAALKNLGIARKMHEDNGQRGPAADILNTTGTIYKTLGNYPEALKHYFSALAIRTETGEKRWMAACYTNIGIVYRHLGNYPEALQNHVAALQLYKQIGNKGLVPIAYTNIGNVFTDQGDYTEALKHQMTALQLFEETGNKGGAAEVYASLGVLYSRQHQFTDALKSYAASHALYSELNSKIGIIDCSIGLGTTYASLKKFTEARQYLAKALSLSREIGIKERIRNAAASLSRLDSAMGNYEQALFHYRLSVEYKDSMFNETASQQIAIMKEQYESEKKDREIGRLNSDKLQLENEKRISALLLARKQDSLLIVQAEKERIKLENDKIKLENEKAQALALFHRQQIGLLGNEKRLQQLQLEKDRAELAIQKTTSDKKQEQLRVVSREKDIQSLQLKKQREATRYFIAGLALLALLSFFVFRNFQNQRKLNRLYRFASEKQMAELQLQSLRAQLNPHFMFNSLNAIQELIVMEENEKAQSYLERFAQLLRQLLDNSNQPFVPLRKEIGFLELYLSLEKLRLPDLQYTIEVEPGFRPDEYAVPNMMLQPYIENALWHGLQHKQGERRLRVHISRQNGSLRYEIRDNGVGRKNAENLKTLYRKEHRSRGMELLNQRFDLLSQECGQAIQTKVTDLTDQGKAAGTLVEIRTPVFLSAPLKKMNS